MRKAVVVAVYPERRSADVVYTDTGMPVAEVHIAGNVSSDGGSWSVPSVAKPGSLSQQASPPDTGRKLIALLDQLDGRPVIVGFMTPSNGQMALTEQNREVHRHASGAYSTVAPDGSMESYHPSGAYVRIGTGAHQSLTPLSKDSAWKEVSGAAQPTITVHTQQFSLVVEPSGNVSLTTTGTVSMTSQGAMSLSAQGALTLHSDADVTITGAHIKLNP